MRTVGTLRPDASRSPTGDDVRLLCRRLRAGLSGDRERPPLPASMQTLTSHRPARLRAGLLNLAERAVDTGRLSRRDVETWACAAGLYGRLERRERVAMSAGISPARLDDLRRRTAAAVAEVWDDGAFNAPAQTAPPAPHLALARTHAETSALANGEHGRAAGEVVADLRNVTLGLPTCTSAPASTAERARRHRVRPAVLARLAQEGGHPLTAPARMLTPSPSELATDPEAVTQLRRARPDPDWLAALVRRGQRSAYDDPALSRTLSHLAIAGYSRPDTPADREGAATAWRLAISQDLPARDMAALWRLDHLRGLLANDDPTLLSASIDVALVLRANGYLRPARRLLWSVLGATGTRRMARADRDRLSLGALAAFGSATPWSASGGEPAEAATDVVTAARSAEQLLRARPIADAAIERTQLRRQFIAAYVAEAVAARAERRRCRRTRRFSRLAGELHATLPAAGPADAIATWLTFARFAADFGDRDGFVHALRRAAPIAAGPLRHHDWAFERAGFARQARRRGWPAPAL